jgi:hypothetical protein
MNYGLLFVLPLAFLCLGGLYFSYFGVTMVF